MIESHISKCVKIKLIMKIIQFIIYTIVGIEDEMAFVNIGSRLP